MNIIEVLQTMAKVFKKYHCSVTEPDYELALQITNKLLNNDVEYSKKELYIL
jgi:hypothetical protein